jgi:hypothetical protein
MRLRTLPFPRVSTVMRASPSSSSVRSAAPIATQSRCGCWSDRPPPRTPAALVGREAGFRGAQCYRTGVRHCAPSRSAMPHPMGRSGYYVTWEEPMHVAVVGSGLALRLSATVPPANACWRRFPITDEGDTLCHWMLRRCSPPRAISRSTHSYMERGLQGQDTNAALIYLYHGRGRGGRNSLEG